jgi:catechol 2,3-dioxygenase-like lactoylglutathione lyase family enzyme
MHRVRGLNHVNITLPAGALPEALAFYHDLLGLADHERPSGAPTEGAWLWIDREAGIELHLTAENGDASGWPTTSGRHIGLLVDDLQATRDRIEAAGLRTEAARPLPNRDRFFVRDPFGNRLELLAFRDGGAGAELR